MTKNVYTHVRGLFLLAAFYLIPAFGLSQDCSSLHVTYTTAESRCMATGVITVQANGGSGNYNYKVLGPVTTSFTSSNIITGLQAGIYTLTVRDVTSNCQVETENVVVSGSYSDPRFLLSKTDVTCARNNGTITVANQQFGRSPFSYTLVAPSPAGVGTVSATGIFSGLIAGEYAVQLRDSCGGIQVRRITVQDYNWWFDGVTVSKTTCNTADALIRLKDNKGNLNTATTTFDGFSYGMVNAPGDTTWGASNQFSFFTGTKRSVTFVAKDLCGKLHTNLWTVPANATPTGGTIGISGTTCTQFTATVTGVQNVTDPTFFLLDNTNTAIDSNTTGQFSNLLYGDYCIHIKDDCYDTTIIKCFTAEPPSPSVNSTVVITDKTCTMFTATINGQVNLYNPEFCLYDSAGLPKGCNNNGIFTGLAYGSYCIKIKDGCTNAVIDRCFTATKPVPLLTGVSITGQRCTSFDARVTGIDLADPEFCLYDSLGTKIACNTTGVFTGIANGNYCIRAISCGDTTSSICFTGVAPKPEVAAAVAVSNKACTTFTATITDAINLTAPQYCLYDSTGVNLACNTTGTFDSIPYGRYCIEITDGCSDTTISRCFTQGKPAPEVAATVEQLNSTCNTFTAKVTGQQNLFDPGYCIYNAANTQLECNTTGVFDALPYGVYCIVITDACTGDSIKLCQTFSYDYRIALATSKSCTIDNANIDVSFTNGISPFTIDVFDPQDSLAYAGTASSTKRIKLPALPSSGVYTIIGTDACGRKDTAMIAPDASTMTKTITSIAKCPSADWLNGSGDLHVDAASNLGTVTPKIFKKNGATFSKAHSSNSGTAYVFSDLEPATYIVEYSIQNCSTKLYDTFALEPYAYPEQGRSAIYQCDNKSINLSADVTGGVGPYIYQIIGSEPDAPSILSAEQSSPEFNINTGITYSLIRLRTVDACGNATLNDVSVLPLQNIMITADTTCLFSPITLSVDTIPEATYSWYKKRAADDSVFLTNDKTYAIEMMRQQDIGTYVCKVELNNSCLTRIASFKLTGDCGDIYLPVAFELTGKAEPTGNTLGWNPAEPGQVQYYEIERKLNRQGDFVAIGRIYITAGTPRFQFMDTGLQQGTVLYRVKAVLQNGNVNYTNSVTLQHSLNTTTVYPNPVHTYAVIQVEGTANSNYHLELHTLAGQKVYEKNLQGSARLQLRYERPQALPKGIYLLKITNRTSGETTYHKLLFD